MPLSLQALGPSMAHAKLKPAAIRYSAQTLLAKLIRIGILHRHICGQRWTCTIDCSAVLSQARANFKNAGLCAVCIVNIVQNKIKTDN